ncbi:hypothetical protein V1477_016451 [Vespula maculifrons]|uniref:Uncharacterized protein n=1 Tax=Vespula maculifrons TaxID=7453 RepID=A0ABD2B0K0_VESMC
MASTEPICVFVSEPPIDLQLHKRREFYSERKTGTLHRNRNQRYKQQIVTREVRRGNPRSKPNSHHRVLPQRRSASVSYPLFPSYEISVTEHDTMSGSPWFPVDSAGVSAAIRYCGYVSRDKTAHLAGILGFPESVHLI